MKSLLLLLIAVWLPCQIYAEDASKKVISVAVIAPSVSTSMMATKLIAEKGWIETNPKTADFLLVVVRSSLSDPLNGSYEDYGELKRDAEMQLNLIGPKFHVYLYKMDDNLRCVQTDHTSFDAKDE
jgi:hypothetical protein